MSTKHIDLSDPKAVAAATDKQFPERPVPDGENSLRVCATDDFPAHPWVTERPGTDRP